MQAKRLRQLAPSTRVETKNADLVMPQGNNQYARLLLNQSVSIQDQHRSLISSPIQSPASAAK